MNISNHGDFSFPIISYQAITGNNNFRVNPDAAWSIISYQAITGNNNIVPTKDIRIADYIIPSDNWEQQLDCDCITATYHYIIPSDNWEQQRASQPSMLPLDYIIPSDNWEQQQFGFDAAENKIISYQAITGNNNLSFIKLNRLSIISYQAITGNNNITSLLPPPNNIISYQAITGNNNNVVQTKLINVLYHTKR